MIEMPRVWNGLRYDRRLHPLTLSVNQSLEPLSTATMILPDYDEIHALDWVQIFTPDGKTEYYRVASVDTEMTNGQKEVYLEHGACSLGDGMIPEVEVDKTTTATSANGASLKEYPENKTDTISNLLNHILSFQGTEYRWAAGTVQATQTIYIELGGMSPLAAISSMMRYIPNYQLEFVQNSAANWVVNIVQRPTGAVCEGRLNRNLRTCEVSYDVKDLCTRVYCKGLTGGYVESSNSAVYGVHSETKNLSDNLSDIQKAAILNSYLSNRDHPIISINISGVELSQVTGLAIDKFLTGTVCRIAIPWLGVVENEVIIEKSYDDVYKNPERVTITLANAKPDLAITMAKVNNKTGGGGGGGGGGAGQQAQAEKEQKRYETWFEQTDRYLKLLATDSEWDEAGNRHVTAYGQIQVQSDNIDMIVQKTGVDDLAEDETLYTRIHQTAEDISLIATSAQLEEVEEEMEQAYQDAYDAAIAAGKTVDEAKEAGEAAKNASTIHAKEQAELTIHSGEISTLVQKTGINSLGQNETIYSKITQTESSLTSTIQGVDGRVSTISQTVDGITLSGNVITIKGSTVNLGDYVLISTLQADYATINSLDALTAEVNNLKAGYSSFTMISASSANISSMALGGTSVVLTALNIGNKSGSYWGNASALTVVATDLPHSHAITMSESGGTVTATIGAVQTSNGTATFSIAATQFYQDAVAAAWDSGAATGTLNAPNSKTLSYDESITVFAYGTDSSGNTVNYGSRTYVAPSDGSSGVTVSVGRSDYGMSGSATVYMSVYASGSNGASDSHTYYMSIANELSAARSDGASGVSVSSWGNPTWNAGGVTVSCTLSNGNSYNHYYAE